MYIESEFSVKIDKYPPRLHGIQTGYFDVKF